MHQENSIDKQTKHVIKSKELKHMMQELNSVVDHDYKSELERDDTRIRYALTLSQKIKEFACKVQIEPKGNLFNQHLKKLEHKGNEIANIVNEYKLEELDAKIVELKNICKSCHNSFGVSNEKTFH
jgi:cytochrome c556